MVIVLIATGFTVGTQPVSALAYWAQGPVANSCNLLGKDLLQNCVFTTAKSRGDGPRVIDIPKGRTDAGRWVGAYKYHGASNQMFSLDAHGDGSFQFKTSANLCLEPGKWDTTWRIDVVQQQRCSGSQKKQYWYLQPRGEADGEKVFLIRNVESDKCLDVAKSWLVGHFDYLNMYDCHGHDNQLWAVSKSYFQDPDATPGTRIHTNRVLERWAAKYALTKCDASIADRSAYPYCRYEQSQVAVTGNAEGVAECVYAQHTEAAIPAKEYDYTVSTSKSTLTNDSIAFGSKLTTTVKIGGQQSFYHAEVALEVSTLLTRSVQHGTVESKGITYHPVVPAAPAHSTTWVKVFPVSKTYTGRFTFAKGSWDEWTYDAPAEITVVYPAGAGHTYMVDSGVTPDRFEHGRWVPQPACVSSGPTETMSST
ncbi:ricin-type beta-trefoil lectin domain protein [Streptomyces sp. NPDC049887]|uniref:ricin-type beta-trefoil lectin domain protein n=1 Tax=unclassified Streptomyces TaxID=2593676 RepID=UPI00343A5D58